ncbi:MAG: M20/M25/M40 family metallo-hydrolase [Pirellulales bacterium]|nr:M20/M25/M40 family metallo-hydrolase [Pirellulales bacterium]
MSIILAAKGAFMHRQRFTLNSHLTRACAIGGLLILQSLSLSSVRADLSDSAVKSAEQSITDEELKQHTAFLSNDTFEGREAGTRGGHAAGGYIVKELSALDLKPAGENGFYQSWGNQYRNILALWEGSDPQLKHELVVIGAHYDHVGYGTSSNSFGPLGYIHNGADDNASGTSALLELAEACSGLENRPKRSILFVWWDAEEKGLLGSKHWFANRTLRNYHVVFTINMDMVGRMKDKRLEIYGVRTAPGLREFVARSMDGIDAQVAYDWDIREDSDHWPFFNAGVPFLMLHTGLHENYHRPSDDAELLNIEGMRETTRLALRLMAKAADRKQGFHFRQASRNESESLHHNEQVPTQPPPSRLGIRWSPEDESNGLILTEVVNGSAAQTAGLRIGDRLLAFNSERIPDGNTFRGWIMATQPDIELSYARGNTQHAAMIQLTGYPVRLGISWKEDDAEPGCVKLSRVIVGSPADVAGLRLGDRVMSVAGQRFASGEEFRSQLDDAGDGVVIEMERAGVIHEVTLQLLRVPRGGE